MARSPYCQKIFRRIEGLFGDEEVLIVPGAPDSGTTCHSLLSNAEALDEQSPNARQSNKREGTIRRGKTTESSQEDISDEKDASGIKHIVVPSENPAINVHSSPEPEKIAGHLPWDATPGANTYHYFNAKKFPSPSPAPSLQ